ncbi:MAG: Conserved TM helix repeat-containing protein [Candidatus Woesebacteria bacterium GW2011_GWB1_38_5b]|uniref:Conserved TM helix repeat-containing protein n=1 Tax=Candidatus Woesebacteria bacterium GW2011_GWB1_38_5b TaxID=1618569 RepID=A0A0G0MIW4_9BACT|nr:MAG: Conserved TM helix repeat-containing protein [Candidatus Woesebacteria bacterium GW2011_GWB1_38_5b]OGH47761.1 MAG: hypothetical protein A3A51_05000 [Candidatus Levybacteria bacterium RIFCSPLOWO2_01_FULL_39_10]
MLEQVRESLLGAINSIVEAIVLYVPKFIAGLIILLIGIIIASIVKTIILSVAKTLKFETFLKRYGVPELRQDYNWSNLIAEISRWFVIIIFLIPTADVWGLPRIGTLLNEVLLYLPNVFVAVVIALVGFVLASLAHDVILASLKGVSQESAKMIATGTQWAISIFVILAVLNQLGVASDLIRILFTGIVAMIAIAGGIAFGLGGQDSARQVLEEFKKRIK